MDKPQRNYRLWWTHASVEERSKKEGAMEEQDEKLGATERNNHALTQPPAPPFTSAMGLSVACSDN